jgi:NAD+ kinase
MPKSHHFQSIGFVASPAPEAQNALKDLTARYGNTTLDEADVIVALGGDGLMLQTLHQFLKHPKPIYGMNRGSVGFLMNAFEAENLPERLQKAQTSMLHPLLMRAQSLDGIVEEAHAINEVSLLRQSHQAAKISISIDGTTRMEELVCDGILLATPAGSTAYNLSAHGPILPLGASLLALTPISAFRPRRWRGALLPDHAQVALEIIEPERRPVSAMADHYEMRAVTKVYIELDRSIKLPILHDPGHSLDERILREQFGN